MILVYLIVAAACCYLIGHYLHNRKQEQEDRRRTQAVIDKRYRSLKPTSRTYTHEQPIATARLWRHR